LDVDDPPGLPAEDAEKGLRMHRPGSHLLIVRLVDDETSFRPEARERENQVL
jgi:hypothetical protein